MWCFTRHTCENSVFHCTSVHCLQHCAALARVQYSLLMGAVWFNSTQQWGQQVHGAWTRGHLGPDWQTWQSEAWFVWTEAHQSSDVTFEVLPTIFLKSFKTSIVTLCVLMPLKRIMEMKRWNVCDDDWLSLFGTNVEVVCSEQTETGGPIICFWTAVGQLKHQVDFLIVQLSWFRSFYWSGFSRYDTKSLLIFGHTKKQQKLHSFYAFRLKDEKNRAKEILTVWTRLQSKPEVLMQVSHGLLLTFI